MNDSWKESPIQTNQKPESDIFFIVARFWAAFMGFEYLFGQLFFGMFDIPGTVTGISGLAAGILSGKYSNSNAVTNRLVLICCVLGIAGISFDAFEYYSEEHSPGNDYSWRLHLSYLLSLLAIGFYRVKHYLYS